MDNSTKDNILKEQIVPLQKITNLIKTTLDDRLNLLEEKLDTLNYSIEHVDSPFKEVKDLKKKVETLEYDNKYISKQLQELELINANLKLNHVSENEELKKVKEAYHSLIIFAFHNINPITDFDPAHAKQYWENLVK
jgi:hypothetical protein